MTLIVAVGIVLHISRTRHKVSVEAAILQMPTFQPPQRVPHPTLLFGATNICRNIKDVPIIFAVLSRIDDVAERDFLRAHWDEYMGGREIPRVFVLGTSEDPQSMEHIRKEFAEHGDLVVSDFLDTYNNLSLKTLSALHFVSANCHQAPAMLKVDLDVLVHVPRLLHLLNSVDLSEAVILGRVWERSAVRRNPEDRNSEYSWPFDVYPPYPSGPCYVVSMPAIDKLLDLKLGFPLWLNEDMNTGFMSLHAGVRLVNHFALFAADKSGVSFGACDGGVVSMHKRFDLSEASNRKLLREWGSCSLILESPRLR